MSARDIIVLWQRNIWRFPDDCASVRARCGQHMRRRDTRPKPWRASQPPINRFVLPQGIREVILVRHSGRGTLAVLVPLRVAGLRTVIAIAANLELGAWTACHGYLPVTDSLDPMDSPPLASSVTELVLVGSVDRKVPPALLEGYREGHPTAQLWTFPGFDHRCCWQEAAQTPLCYNLASGVVQGCCAPRIHSAQVAGGKGPPQRLKFAPTTGSRQRILQ